MNKPTKSEITLFVTEDQKTRIEVRLEGETVWLTQKQIAELFQKDVRTINEHLKNIFEEQELLADSVIRNFRITADDGKTYETQHYNLDAIIAVGYRVKSPRGTQFRIWATERLRDYLVKGFTLDDERLKQRGGGTYFEELLARIRDIRSSEKVFWKKVLDIYATSIDYAPDIDMSQKLFATVQNKMHWAAHGHTAAELNWNTDSTETHVMLTDKTIGVNLFHQCSNSSCSPAPKAHPPLAEKTTSSRSARCSTTSSVRSGINVQSREDSRGKYQTL